MLANSSCILSINIIASSIAYLAVCFLLPKCYNLFISANLVGRDLHKNPQIQLENNLISNFNENEAKRKNYSIPEATGIICACVYFSILSLFTPLISTNFLKFILFESSIICICFSSFLGFADNVLNLRWRIKIILPLIGALPVVVSYANFIGETSVLLPTLSRPALFDLGCIFYFFLILSMVFSTNCINIYAGINGLEVGQTILVSISLGIVNLIQICRHEGFDLFCFLSGPFSMFFTRGLRHPEWNCSYTSIDGNEALPYASSNYLSLYLLCPLIGVSLGLYRYNRFPAKVFSGDVYCYFGGMVISCAAIVGQNVKTMFLFFIPQLFNFSLSLPQLVLDFIPCPRHRLPRSVWRVDGGIIHTGKSHIVGKTSHSFGDVKHSNDVSDSTVEHSGEGKDSNDISMKQSSIKTIVLIPSVFKIKKPVYTSSKILKLYSFFIHLITNSQISSIIANEMEEDFIILPNMTLLNVILCIVGPQSEKELFNITMVVQMVFSLIAFVIRFGIVLVFYSRVI